MPKIMILDPLTANQIAAGEVVERPFSVVKELVENSIDAGAKRIIVDLEEGGLASVSVSDDGCGMSEEDLLLAFQRHATSKIKCAFDLCRIATLGFRGEALPSIASISSLTVTTRTHGALNGTRAVVEGGDIVAVAPAGCPAGTTVLVRDLFYNTPARRKAMKSPSSEGSLCGELVSRLALARPDLRYEMKIKGRRVFYSPGFGHLLDSVTAVYGTQLAKEMLPVHFSEKGLTLNGLTGKPSLSRSTRSHITVIINGRYVRCPVVTTAVEEAYHSLLPQGRRPVTVLALSVKPEFLDVNVHPAKLEVRLLEEEKTAKLVTRALMEALRVKEIIPSTKITRPKVESGRQEENQIQLTIQPQQASRVPPGMEMAFCEPVTAEYRTVSAKPLTLENNRVAGSLTTDHTADVDEKTAGSLHRENQLPILNALAQLPPTYILAGSEEGLYIVDQHAAHERILYESYLFSKGEKQSQCLLIPVMLELDYRDAAVLTERVLWFADAGFILEHFGDNSFLLRGVPTCFPAGQEKSLFLDLLDFFRERGRGLDQFEFYDRLAASMACRNAVKAGDKLSIDSMDALLKRLTQTNNPFTCPHGRPTVIHLSYRDLETRFKR